LPALLQIGVSFYAHAQRALLLRFFQVDWCGDVKDDPLVGRKDYIAFSNAITHTSRSMYFMGVAAYPFLLTEVGEYVRHHHNLAPAFVLPLLLIYQFQCL